MNIVFNLIFGLCMGSVIGRLLNLGEYFHMVLALVAFVMGLILLVR